MLCFLPRPIVSTLCRNWNRQVLVSRQRLQARRQEMKWGRVFFVKKVENGGCFFFEKNVDLSSTQGALCTVSVFFILHFTYLERGVRTHPTHPPLPTGLVMTMLLMAARTCQSTAASK